MPDFVKQPFLDHKIGLGTIRCGGLVEVLLECLLFLFCFLNSVRCGIYEYAFMFSLANQGRNSNQIKSNCFFIPKDHPLRTLDSSPYSSYI